MFRRFEMDREGRACGKDRHHEGRENRGVGRHGSGGAGRGRAGETPFGRGGFERGLGRGFGGGRERMFDGGVLRLLVLHFLKEQPSYGYALIKTLEEQMGGGYTPSAGVIYPTLTMLEEQGFTVVSSVEGGKKTYSVTADGLAHLQENKAVLDAVLSRMKHTGRGFERGRSPQIMEALSNLRRAMRTRVTRGSMTAEQVKKVGEAINAAATAIDEL